MGKYSIVKSIVTNIPYLREFGASFFTFLPNNISPKVYSIMRNKLFKDNQNRVHVYKNAFETLKSRETEPLGYLEFGVARGTSLISNFHISKEVGFDNLRFFAFDSFQGLPESEGKVFKKGTMSYGLGTFKKFVSKAGVDLKRVSTIEGFFNESLNDELLSKLKLRKGVYIVHIDCDLYSSTLTVLKWLIPFLDKNSVIIFDDWVNAS